MMRGPDSLTDVKGIVFDLDNTLYFYETAHVAALRASHRAYPVKSSFTKFHQKYERARVENEKQLRGMGASHNRILYFQRMLERDECFAPQRALDLAKVYWIAFIKSMKLEPGLREILLALTRQYKLGMLSDLTAHAQFAKISAHRLWPFFDAIVTSEEAGAEKPSDKGLRMLLRKLGLDAQEVIFVGDNPSTDGLCAAAAGVRYIQITRQSVPNRKRNITVPIWRKIKTLKELIPLLTE